MAGTTSPGSNQEETPSDEGEERTDDAAEDGDEGDGEEEHAHRGGAGALTLAALGVVFGDIGTSPLYALDAVFASGAVLPDVAGVYGIVSLVFWAIVVVVSIKYLTFIMRADNEGEGGIMALIALVQGIDLNRRAAKLALIGLGIFGAALFYGDGMITPAISVLSAVEGLELAAPSLETYVVPIALVVLVVLFGIQRFGTGAVGTLFGPIMCLWFGTLAFLGVAKLLEDPAILVALSPTYALSFLSANSTVGFLALGSVVLVVTGAEALYADMGHFGRPPIRRAWFLVVFPALTLNYLGQGALILQSPEAIASPLFRLVPEWGLIPLVLLATAAAVIASQAVISGAFSVTRQAVQLGFLPWLSIKHTSREEVGQVYSPAVNGVLFVAVVALVVGFASSEGLAGAYGIAVTGTLAVDTVLFFVLVRVLWRRPLPLVVLGCALFLVVDLAFLGANLPKIPAGGWFPLVIGLVIFTVLMTWRRGREILTPRREEQEGDLRDFIEEIRSKDPPIRRVPGTAIFLHAGKETTPLALRDNVDHNRVLHECTVIVSIEMARVPHIPHARRLSVDELGYEDDGISHVTAHFGFSDEPDLPQALRLPEARKLETDLDLDHATYFLSKMTIVRTKRKGMMGWRKKLFTGISYAGDSPAEYFALPGDRIVTMGSHIDL